MEARQLVAEWIDLTDSIPVDLDRRIHWGRAIISKAQSLAAIDFKPQQPFYKVNHLTQNRSVPAALFNERASKLQEQVNDFTPDESFRNLMYTIHGDVDEYMDDELRASRDRIDQDKRLSGTELRRGFTTDPKSLSADLRALAKQLEGGDFKVRLSKAEESTTLRSRRNCLIADWAGTPNWQLRRRVVHAEAADDGSMANPPLVVTGPAPRDEDLWPECVVVQYPEEFGGSGLNTMS